MHEASAFKLKLSFMMYKIYNLPLVPHEIYSMAQHESESTLYLYGQYENIRKAFFIREIPSYHCFGLGFLKFSRILYNLDRKIRDKVV